MREWLHFVDLCERFIIVSTWKKLLRFSLWLMQKAAICSVAARRGIIEKGLDAEMKFNGLGEYELWNFGRLALGYVEASKQGSKVTWSLSEEADFRDQILVGKLLTISTNCTFSRFRFLKEGEKNIFQNARETIPHVSRGLTSQCFATNNFHLTCSSIFNQVFGRLSKFVNMFHVPNLANSFQEHH